MLSLLCQANKEQKIEGQASALIAQIVEAGWAQQQRVEAGAEVGVGVNRFVEPASPPGFALHRHAEGFEAEQPAAPKSLGETRDSERVRRALAELRSAAASTANLLPVLVETVKTYATIGEMCGVLRELFGEYRAPQVYSLKIRSSGPAACHGLSAGARTPRRARGSRTRTCRASWGRALRHVATE